MSAAFNKNADLVAKERKLYAPCLDMNPETKAGRDCFVAVAPKLTDWQTTRAAALQLSRWISVHRDDAAARNSAIALMDRAWSSWYRDYQPEYAKLDALNETTRNFVLVRLALPNSTAPKFENLLYRLTEATEVGVLSPEAAQRQFDRYREHGSGFW
ncbi:hypothetical protein F6X40_11420 [Paraburkholderia sp. UCT31]|uniref:hypothetical protein n=1 Tax=Paraburkholderia sp. UCT31 TaxID=2615209 RepID=UPI0016562241|nr:hypothetical protein [Paraburkholderia sp. UCT31]MBC8737414.1 hypothetical protein [Paraburkholderia sp. UCT31]